MASVNSLSSASSSSSIYGNRTYNIISGLASGLDTEELISGVVQSYQQKIQSLQSKNTKLQWQQEAYQSISDKLVEFYRNYATFAYSNNNLASSSFFNNAVITSTNGKYANLVTATGKTSSDVMLNAVKQLASAARYTHDASNLTDNITVDDSGKKITGDSMEINSDNTVDVSKLAGSLTITYGNQEVTLDFGEREFFEKDGQFDVQTFQNAINQKLKEQKISTNNGSGSADEYISVKVRDDGSGHISLTVDDLKNSGNTFKISEATGSLGDLIGKQLGDDTKTVNLGIPDNFTDKKALSEFIDGESITVTLDGKKKTISLDGLKDVKDLGEFEKALNEELRNAFGTEKVTNSDGSSSVVNKISATLDPKDGISFTMAPSIKNSTMSVTASNRDVGDILGIGSGLTSYLDTTKTLGDLGGLSLEGLTAAEAVGDITEKKAEDGSTYRVDSEGYRVNDDNKRIDEDGNLMYDLEINGVKIGSYSKNTELNTVINDINANTEAGVNISYSKTTGQFVFTAKDTGSSGRVEIEAGGLGERLFGKVTRNQDTGELESDTGTYESGRDAQIIATINGQTMELTRSSNSFDLDGMNITVNGTFNPETTVDEVEAAIKDGKLDTDSQITFTSKTDADTIVDAVKKMVEDLNTLIKEVKSAYSDMPLQKNDGSSYEPLSDEAMEGMSESAIENYEKKAKTGILFMDNDLSSLYNDLRNAITSSGADGATLRSIGIETSYSDGLTTLTFNEEKFRAALESDPDKVQEAFTKSKENGAATDGLMTRLTGITDKYAATTGDVKGILIEKAGSKYSPSAALDNTLLDQMKDVEEEISKWQDKMSNKVDYYTNKFTQLELLINQMNSQSSALAGLMGG